MDDTTPTWTRKEQQALDLLARGAVRYGTRIGEMRKFKALGLCCAYDRGSHLKRGRWLWVPTAKGWEVLKKLEATRG